MSYEFRLPDVGEGIAEAEVVRWLVQEGQRVELDQPLVEIQTDKAIVEVPAPVAGVVERRGAGEGDLLHVGDLLVLLDTGTANNGPDVRVASPISEPPSAAGKAQNERTPSAAPANSGIVSRPLATPAVRKLARELGVDLALVSGSGPGGRITAEDVQAFAAGAQPEPAPAPASEAKPPAQPEQEQLSPSAAPADGRDRREPLRGLRRRIAEAMSESWRTIPHITGYDEVAVGALVHLRQQLQPAAEAAGVHLTYLPFIVKAAVAALKQQPIVNAWLDERAGEIVYRGSYNIGIATATPDGLIVPVLHDADRKTLRELQGEISDLTEQARSRRIALPALQGGTFTITNFGALGGWLGTPIIRPGEAAILGVGRIEDRPWAVEGRLEVQPVLALSLSADHRLIDGDVSTAFLRTIAGYLADPLSLLLELT